MTRASTKKHPSQNLAAFVLAALVSHAHPAFSTTIARCDIGPQGQQEDYAIAPIISGSGKFLTFTSSAPGNVAGDTNNVADVFVHSLQTGETNRVSVSSDGTEANGSSDLSSLSGDGRYVVFTSYATNLVPGDTNSVADIFVHDRKTGRTERVSVVSGGAEADGPAATASISDDGRFVVFNSAASNLVPNDRNAHVPDVFIHDRIAHETIRIAPTDGIEPDGPSGFPKISGDGEVVTFTSAASNLVPGDTNGKMDVFAYSRKTGKIDRVSVASDGTQGDGPSLISSLNSDGRYVAFTSGASNLVPDDTNDAGDAFVHDRQTGETVRVSMASGGEQGNQKSFMPAISGNGRFVAFASAASNLVKGDSNGHTDIFLRNLETRRTVRLSEGVDGAEPDGNSESPSITDNGRRVAFESTASNLVPGDTNGDIDTFVSSLGKKSAMDLACTHR